jgi:Na+-transporting NADH:ubiquinone oxidoreductase subunit F
MAVAIAKRDYSLVGDNTIRALQKGLAEATWYTSPVPKEKLRELLERRDGPAVRDTLIWFAALLGAGVSGYALWRAGSWWAVVPFMIYGIIYASSSDSRWHEAGHGTAFKTDWMNNALYEIASFMVMRESVPWRWSHVRHHSDTIIIGRDPEIAVPRPPDIFRFLIGFFSLRTIPVYFYHVVLHAAGRLTAEEKTYVPESEYGKAFWRARIYLLIYAAVFGLALYHRTVLPLMYIGFPQLYGAWLTPIYAYPQHAGLAENVLDHRLNCRTLYMNPIHRFLYWNMNYHVEHHMFPLVPYHNLPRLHELVKADMPAPYPSLLAAWRELVPAVLRQVKDPSYYVERKLPTPSPDPETLAGPQILRAKGRVINGWAEVCVSGFLRPEEVIRFDHEKETYAIYRNAEGQLFATAGLCTHARAHLAEGFVKGNLVECPKHNGRFDFTDGSPQRKPVCVALRTFPARERDGKIFLQVTPARERREAVAQPLEAVAEHAG